jgi:hypothetical protein
MRNAYIEKRKLRKSKIALLVAIEKKDASQCQGEQARARCGWKREQMRAMCGIHQACTDCVRVLAFGSGTQATNAFFPAAT